MTGLLGPLGYAVLVTILVGVLLSSGTLLIARRSLLVATALGPVVGVLSVAAGIYAGSHTMSIEESSVETINLILIGSLPIAVLAGCGTALHSWRRERTLASREAERSRQAELDASRKEMITWISHDLRTPLAGIRAMTEALQDGMAPDPDAYLDRIHSEAGRTASMVDDLLSLSSAHAGVSSQSGWINVPDLISDTLATASASASQLTVNGSAEPDLTLRGDLALLSRALWNLVSNAITHTNPGGRILVEAVRLDNQVLIGVTDQCGGIPEEDLAQVFNPGWRGTRSRGSGPDGGAGLGLAIVAAAAELFDGTARVENVCDGCRFTLVLPVTSGENSPRT